jgi:hypothetical protein
MIGLVARGHRQRRGKSWRAWVWLPARSHGTNVDLYRADASLGYALELIAKAFGYESWNILSAKIEAAEPPQSAKPPGSDNRLLSVAAEKKPPPPKTLYCSFCGKSQHEVRKLIAGPTVFICDECVALCTDIVDGRA